jgi:hypothetical protein
MKNYFGYSKNIVYKERADFTTEAWENMIYNELAAGRPVILDGMTSTSTILAEGHAFICDGYDGSGMFHINWGWNNGSDGYFLLNALNPPEQGTGGSYSGQGFNYDQAAIVGIAPAGSEEEIPVINPEDPDDDPQNPDENPTNPDDQNPKDDDPNDQNPQGEEPNKPNTPTVDPKPIDDIPPTEAELTLLRQSMDNTEEKALALRNISLQYQQSLSVYKTKALALKETNDNLLAKLNDLEKKSNRDDIDSYFHEVIERCINTITTQIVAKLDTATTEIDEGISYCQNYIDNLNRIDNGIKQLKNNVDTVQTRNGFTDLQSQSNEAFATIHSMTGMTIIEESTQTIDYMLRNIESMQVQMNDFYNQIEPLLLEAIDEADPKGEWEILERLKQKLSAEGDSLEDLRFKLRMEENVCKSIVAQQGTLMRSLQELENQIREVIDQIDAKEQEFDEAAAILSELQRTNLTKTLTKARTTIRNARSIAQDIIKPLFDSINLLGENDINNLITRSEEIDILRQQYPTQELLNEVKKKRQQLEKDFKNAMQQNTNNRSIMADIGVAESDLLVSLNSAREILDWFSSDLQSAIAIAKEVKAQEEEELRQRELEQAHTDLYELAPNVSVELLALEGDLNASQTVYDNCIKIHESVLQAESDFLNAARNVAKLLAELPSDSKARKDGQERLNALIQYATQDVPARLSNINRQLEESKTEFRTMKSIFENAYEQIPQAEAYNDIMQLLTRIRGVENSATEMATKLAKLRAELASLKQYITEEPERLSLTMLRLTELEIDINLAILSVDDIKANDRQVMESYDVSGRRLSVGTSDNQRRKGVKGFRIVRYNDGSVRKIKE